MRFTKKVMSVALCTVLLSGGSLSMLSNIAHADSNNGICARTSERCWTETLSLKLKRKTSPLEKSYLNLNLVEYSDGKVRLEYNGYVPSLYDYLFDDDYVFGTRGPSSGTTDFRLDNSGVGPFQNGNIAKKVDDFINKFNNSNIRENDFMYMHGVRYDDTLKFSGKEIKRPSSKGYENGYKSRGIDKWKNGFQLTKGGLYECALVHK